MGKSTINGHFQKQTVKLPEGIFIALHLMNLFESFGVSDDESSVLFDAELILH